MNEKSNKLDRTWRTSTRSGDNGACVEVRLTDVVEVRDSKSRASGSVPVSPASWQRFMDAVKQGRFDL